VPGSEGDATALGVARQVAESLGFLSERGDSRVVNTLLEMCGDRDANVKMAAMRAVATVESGVDRGAAGWRASSSRVREVLVRRALDEDAFVRKCAVATLAHVRASCARRARRAPRVAGACQRAGVLTRQSVPADAALVTRTGGRAQGLARGSQYGFDALLTGVEDTAVITRGDYAGGAPVPSRPRRGRGRGAVRWRGAARGLTARVARSRQRAAARD
jgi:hypothetical protein